MTEEVSAIASWFETVPANFSLTWYRATEPDPTVQLPARPAAAGEDAADAVGEGVLRARAGGADRIPVK